MIKNTVTSRNEKTKKYNSFITLSSRKQQGKESWLLQAIILDEIGQLIFADIAAFISHLFRQCTSTTREEDCYERQTFDSKVILLIIRLNIDGTVFEFVPTYEYRFWQTTANVSLQFAPMRCLNRWRGFQLSSYNFIRPLSVFHINSELIMSHIRISSFEINVLRRQAEK